METFLKAVGAIVVGAITVMGVVFLSCVGGAFFGALGGTVVGWFYPRTIAAGLAAFHIGPLAPWQLGMFLGFFGGFFKASLSATKKDD